MRFTERDEKRFWMKVALPEDQGCMLWLSSTNFGYGLFSLNGKTARAHRVSYELTYGPIPVGLQIDHLCRVRRCVAPLHLEAVTQRENGRRGMSGEWQQAKTHCPQGHPYEGDNLYLRPGGARGCRTCVRAAGQKWYRTRGKALRANA